MTTERGGIYEPQVVPEREERYMRYYGQQMPLVTKMMLFLQDDPKKTRDFYKDHFAKATEGAALRKIVQSLPVKDEQLHMKGMYNHGYRATKAKQADAPKVGTPAYFLKQMGE